MGKALRMQINLPTVADPVVRPQPPIGSGFRLMHNLPAIPVAAQLAFTTQPNAASANAVFIQQPVIAVENIFGTLVTTSTVTVSIAIKPGTGTPGAALSGAQPVTAVAGIVTFPNLSIDTIGTGYILTASAPGLPSVDSAPFDVTIPMLLWDFIPGITPTVAAPFGGTRTPHIGGNWTVTDAVPTGGKAFQTKQGYLRVAQLGSAYTQNIYGWGYTALAGAGLSRVQGRTFAAVVDIEDPYSAFAMHWATNPTPGDPTTNGTSGDGILIQAYGFEALVNSREIPISTSHNNSRPNQYFFAVTLQGTGCYVWVSLYKADPGKSGNMDDPIGIPQFPNMRLLYAGGTDAAATLFPMLDFSREYNYDWGHAFKHVQVFDVVSSPAWTLQNGLAVAWDAFNAANGTSLVAHTLNSGGAWLADAGSATIQSNTAQLAASSRLRTTGAANCLIQDTMAFSLASAQENRLIFRWTDANNYNYLRCVQGATFVMGKVVAGVNTILRQGGPNLFTKGAGGSYDVAISMQGNNYKIWLDGVAYNGTWYVETSNANLTGTGIGFDSTSQGGGTVSHTNFNVFPHTVTAPSEIQGCSAAPINFTPGITLVQDSMSTVTAGQHLSAHTPAIGPAWIEQHGSWVGDGAGHVNAAVSSSDTIPALALQDMGQIDVEYSVDITMKSVIGTWIFGGVVGRYIDDNNFFVCRAADYVVGQPFDQEIELNMFVGGFSYVVHKTQFGVPYVASGTNTLTFQFKAETLHIFLNGNPVESFVLPPELCAPTATKFGLYHIYPDDSVQGFSNVLVKSLSDPGVSGIPGSMVFTDLDTGGVSGSPSSMTFND